MTITFMDSLTLRTMYYCSMGNKKTISLRGLTYRLQRKRKEEEKDNRKITRIDHLNHFFPPIIRV